MMNGRTGTAMLVLAGSALAATGAAAQQAVTLTQRDRMLSEQPASVFTVGAADGQNWEMFSGIMALAFDAADNLYVLDSQNTRVVVFDRSGRFVRQFGKRGNGPGELQAPMGLTVATDGSVVVNDLGNRAFIVFRSTGEHVRNVPYPMDGAMPLGPVFADPRGGVVTRWNNRMMDPSAGSESQVSRLLLADDASPVPMLRFEVPPPQVINPDGNRRMVISVDPVFSARPSYGVLPDGGLVLHTGEEYAVKVYDRAGRHVRTLTRPITPKRVTKRDRDAWEERSRSDQGGGQTRVVVSSTMSSTGGGTTGGVTFGGAGGGGGQGMPMNIDRPFAEVMSVVTGTRADPAGRVWVQRRADDGRDAGPIDIADASGRYIGTLPAGPLPSAFSASGLAAWIVRDELGIEQVAVRRLPQGWR